MRTFTTTKKIKFSALFLTALLFVFAGNGTAGAVTREELLPQLFGVLGHDVPAKYFSKTDGDLTKSQAVRMALESMGWGFVIDVYEQMELFPEWSDRNPISDIGYKMQPHAPTLLLSHLDEPFTSDDVKPLKTWLYSCKKTVSLKGAFVSENGIELDLIKHGIGDPDGPANGVMKPGLDQPVYAAVLCINIADIPCRIATAQMMGAKRASLSALAGGDYGVIGGVNGGYFAGSKPIGVLRRQGLTENAKFWPNRSAFGWNAAGETIFIDGKQIGNIAADKELDKYTEMLQAGPLLLKDGAAVNNTEKVHPNVLDKRHPRTIVGTDGKRIMWAVIDGRRAMHSVGATIAESRTVCKWLGIKTALNLDGGGSSSLWWRGVTVTWPSGGSGEERKIPYAVLMYEKDAADISK